MYRKIKYAAALVSILTLAACANGKTAALTKPVDSLMGKHAETELRLSTAAAEAMSGGKTKEALDLYAELYGKSSSDKTVAVNYAQLLRKTGDHKKALSILSGHLSKNNGNQSATQDPLVLNEYAACQIAAGQFQKAEKTLDRVLEDKKASAYHADAYNLMGVALEGLGHHREAEQMFRLSIETWKGNPTPVMNNLALNLASQGMFDESLSTLRKALIMAPDKQEIARNIQIVSDLRASIVPNAPVDIRKN